MPRYKGKGGYEALEGIFSAEMLYEQKLEVAMKKFSISKITAVRWYREYKKLRAA
jgi:hypothetical protein